MLWVRTKLGGGRGRFCFLHRLARRLALPLFPKYSSALEGRSSLGTATRQVASLQKPSTVLSSGGAPRAAVVLACTTRDPRVLGDRGVPEGNRVCGYVGATQDSSWFGVFLLTSDF